MVSGQSPSSVPRPEVTMETKREIKITPGMIDAGIVAASRWLGEAMPSDYVASQLVREVFEQMVSAAASGSSSCPSATASVP